ncbi:uncharacterized protein MONOS_13957 [Monocercomonoides exilis]|uniref:uncharacterized protein n=1 Tax=Monocercomonoides exilis TaxID=2049356 RepID=UPI00355941DD|nr:hypothetical protein MONOS_13957 [Monocercomonoides exilis]|eukprot:MONOS_13957.1-p1 / transcript=MONOS_13957.1 / gene=MONOS_13957 / organism=Monocercomonoides_exilis_PA203 / gene_product=unspecified product / transcript_product=unspecified product / location=Mono_scaffold00911:1789-3913(+) / protein_length=682 / sequence_SO=supercontig / SO=protein_coding / is_pseudo=false
MNLLNPQINQSPSYLLTTNSRKKPDGFNINQELTQKNDRTMNSFSNFKWVSPSQCEIEGYDDYPEVSFVPRETEEKVEDSLSELKSINKKIQEQLVELQATFNKEAQEHKRMLMRSFKDRLHEEAIEKQPDHQDEIDADASYWIKRFRESSQTVSLLQMELERVHRLNESLSIELKRKAFEYTEFNEENTELQVQQEKLLEENRRLKEELLTLQKIGKEKLSEMKSRAKTSKESTRNFRSSEKTKSLAFKGTKTTGSAVVESEEELMRAAEAMKTRRRPTALEEVKRALGMGMPSLSAGSSPSSLSLRTLHTASATSSAATTARMLLSTNRVDTKQVRPSQLPLPSSPTSLRRRMVSLRNELAERKEEKAKSIRASVAEEAERKNLQQIMVDCIEDVQEEMEEEEEELMMEEMDEEDGYTADERLERKKQREAERERKKKEAELKKERQSTNEKMRLASATASLISGHSFASSIAAGVPSSTSSMLSGSTTLSVGPSASSRSVLSAATVPSSTAPSTTAVLSATTVGRSPFSFSVDSPSLSPEVLLLLHLFDSTFSSATQNARAGIGRVRWREDTNVDDDRRKGIQSEGQRTRGNRTQRDRSDRRSERGVMRMDSSLDDNSTLDRLVFEDMKREKAERERENKRLGTPKTEMKAENEQYKSLRTDPIAEEEQDYEELFDNI